MRRISPIGSTSRLAGGPPPHARPETDGPCRDVAVRIEAAGDTHVGRVRSRNEDAIFVGETVFVVADGMGGAAGGQVASSTAVESLAELDGSRFQDQREAEEAMRTAVEDANRAVRRTADGDPGLEGMGTTVTAVMVDGDDVYVGHVGDSRAYLLRDGQLRQLTHDHSLVQQLVDMGQLTEEEAANHPQAAAITRAVGLSLELDVDVDTVEPVAGDRLLLCSDGLTRVVDDDGIRECLAAHPEPGEAADALIDDSNERGGPDNISVVVLAFHA